MTELWRRLPLPLKIALPAALLCLLCSLAVVIVLQRSQQGVIEERLDALGTALVSRLANSAASSLVADDPLALQAVVSGFAGEAAVERAAVYDNAHHVVAAAGDEHASSWDYTQTIQWQDAAIGRAVLTLSPDAVASELLHATDLAVVALVASLLAGAIALWVGQRLDALLGRLARRLAGDDVAISYRGKDQLGRLLHTPAPPVLPEESVVAARSDLALLQTYCPDENDRNANEGLRLAATVAQLYGGRAEINRAGGVLLRFRVAQGPEDPFQAVCAATLLAELTRELELRLALTHLPEAEAHDEWRQQRTVEAAYRQVVSMSEPGLAIGPFFSRDPAVAERIHGHAVAGDWTLIKGLSSPYAALLKRQCAALRQGATA